MHIYVEPENELECQPTSHKLTHRDGKLHCTQCGGENGDMPTACPGEYMDEEMAHEVAHGGLDCLPGRGWVHLKARLEFNQKRAAAHTEYAEAVFEAAVANL